jgi:hypothetical protein
MMKVNDIVDLRKVKGTCVVKRRQTAKCTNLINNNIDYLLSGGSLRIETPRIVRRPKKMMI